MERWPLLMLACLWAGCNFGGNADIKPVPLDSLERKEILSNSPVLSPERSLAAMEVEDGFEVKLVAAEPLVSTPIALTFDDKGRIWVLEMEGYMPDTLGTGEDRPSGKIAILEDRNGDGIMDNRKVFMDSLILPRALCLIENGLLVAEPPNLWYIEINNDRAGKKTLVDADYAVGGNVEHQPNGLLRGMDNWIYNAKSARRYRKKGDQWLIERTHFRGQWGISRDDFGRLYYNNNSQNLIGDYFLPALGSGNENQRSVAGYNVDIVKNNRVYPIRPTTGVNRGYMENILDDSSRLVNFTAACGPLVYRGGLFDNAYHENVFVAEPSANLIKRNIREEKGYITEGKQAYAGREFLASIDERFRPVNLYNGPDGAMYVADMYRGIIQHRTYLTDYLKKEIGERALSAPLNCGRIYKIVPAGKIVKPFLMPHEPLELVNLLKDKNGWVRDKAQQMLVDGKMIAAAPELRKLLAGSDDPVSIAHAMWTLEGLGILQYEDIVPLFRHSNWQVRAAALGTATSVVNNDNYKHFAAELRQVMEQQDTLTAPYIAFQLHCINAFDQPMADTLWMDIAQKYPDNRYVADALISNIEKREKEFYQKIRSTEPDTSLAINRQFEKTLNDIKKNESGKNLALLNKQFPKGAQVYQHICKTCHGTDGNGIASLAPPLNQSSWVTGDKRKLIAIVLYGLTGPVTVNNKVYKAPEVSGEMPGLLNNDELNEEDIAQVLSYIRKNWNNNASNVTKEEVLKIRQHWNNRQQPFTAEELKQW
ncbi:MAG TPA: c-type cytochrome [Agriterribacter sp.]|nr:c-type cytochrome [Agriterribacter sp.]HRQ50388.1 c-type cytochrome [Agriterribacter sp.]